VGVDGAVGGCDPVPVPDDDGGARRPLDAGGAAREGQDSQDTEDEDAAESPEGAPEKKLRPPGTPFSAWSRNEDYDWQAIGKVGAWT
jgi:hypothetical protein